MTSEWPGPAWLDCDGGDAGDGKVRCTIRLLGGGIREILVPAELFDAERRRLKVRIVRPWEPEDDPLLDCPSQELEAMGFIIDCPAIEGESNSRLDVLAAFLNARSD